MFGKRAAGKSVPNVTRRSGRLVVRLMELVPGMRLDLRRPLRHLDLFAKNLDVVIHMGRMWMPVTLCAGRARGPEETIVIT